MDLRIKAEQFPIQHQLAASYNREVAIYWAVGAAFYTLSQKLRKAAVSIAMYVRPSLSVLPYAKMRLTLAGFS